MEDKLKIRIQTFLVTKLFQDDMLICEHAPKWTRLAISSSPPPSPLSYFLCQHVLTLSHLHSAPSSCLKLIHIAATFITTTSIALTLIEILILLSILLGVSHLSLTLNSSVNFLIYFSLGKKFKTVSKRLYLESKNGLFQGSLTLDSQSSSQ